MMIVSIAAENEATIEVYRVAKFAFRLADAMLEVRDQTLREKMAIEARLAADRLVGGVDD